MKVQQVVMVEQQGALVLLVLFLLEQFLHFFLMEPVDLEAQLVHLLMVAAAAAEVLLLLLPMLRVQMVELAESVEQQVQAVELVVPLLVLQVLLREPVEVAAEVAEAEQPLLQPDLLAELVQLVQQEVMGK